MTFFDIIEEYIIIKKQALNRIHLDTKILKLDIHAT